LRSNPSGTIIGIGARVAAATLAIGLIFGGAVAVGAPSGASAARVAAPAATATAAATTATTATKAPSVTAVPATATSSPTVTALPATATGTPTRTATGTPTRTATGTPTRTPSATATVAASATTRPTGTARPTTIPRASLRAVGSTTTQRGGVITVSGRGFAPNETVTLTLSGVSGTAASAVADPHGAFAPTGVGIPFALAPGRQTITATGTASKRSATLTIRVLQLTTRITLSPSTVSPGTTETVRGTGFASQEQVTLSLNGGAVTTSPAVITTTNGAFTATFVAPPTLLRGANTVSAFGNQSRNSAAATLIGSLSRTAQFYYFAGAPNTGSSHSFIALLNPNAQPSSVRLTFYFDSGAQFTKLVSVRANAEQIVSAAAFGFPEGTFGLRVNADRLIAAQINVERDGQDGDAILGVSAPNLRWYLATGSTGGSFQERVSILNPSATLIAHVQLQLLTPVGQRSRTVVVTVYPHTNDVVNINGLLPNHNVSVAAIADQPVVVERGLTFGRGGAGLTTRLGVTNAATNWLFTDATTENNVHTIFTVENPGDGGALVTASYSSQSGGSLGSATVYVAGRSRATIDVARTVRGGGIAVAVTSNANVVVERAEYIGAPDQATAGSDVFGRNGTSTRVLFPGGNTNGRDEALILYNPSAVTAPVTAVFYGQNGQTVTQRLTLNPGAHQAIAVNTLNLTVNHGAVLSTTSPVGFIAEQGISNRSSTVQVSSQGLAQ